MSTGRSFAEILRALDSLQLTARHQVATPVNWQHSEDVIIVPAVLDEAAKRNSPNGWTSPKPYIRLVSAAARLTFWGGGARTAAVSVPETHCRRAAAAC